MGNIDKLNNTVNNTGNYLTIDWRLCILFIYQDHSEVAVVNKFQSPKERTLPFTVPFHLLRSFMKNV